MLGSVQRRRCNLSGGLCEGVFDRYPLAKQENAVAWTGRLSVDPGSKDVDTAMDLLA
jgi:hypothetical protein